MTERNWKPTACILCECNCGIEVEVEDRALRRFRGDKKHPASAGYVCEKPARLNHYQSNPHRLLSPLRRREDGTFEAVSWETAISEIAARFSHLRDTFGGQSIFYYGGGGQGNHLPGAYAAATRRALKMRYRSNALAQEKTGEFLVSQRMTGTQTRGDFATCEVAMFIGKNPWQSHGMPHARVTLKKIAKDPDRAMIVIDPRRTKTAALADFHLQVKPGCDAWLLTAMVGVLVQEDLLDHEFLAEKADGVEAVKAAFAGVPVADYCARAGVDEDLVRRAVRRMAAAKSVASFEDLGVQMNRHSTVVSYLHRLLWMLTGNFGKPGTHYTPGVLVRIAYGEDGRKSPVVGAPLISGLVPCNVIADEILTDHADRYRGMIVETANPAHSLADSPRMREALSALDTLVVIDVAMTETAKLADYVLPASTQFEKAEATFFNFEFPDNYFHLRHRLLAPPEGPLSEAEIHARLCEALGAYDDTLITPLRQAAEQGVPAFGAAFLQRVISDRRYSGLASVILYRTLGAVMPEAVREGAVLLGLAFRAAMQGDPGLARAGFDGPAPFAAMKLFEAIIASPSGVVMSRREWGDVTIDTPNKRLQLDQPEFLTVVASLKEAPAAPPAAFPLILAAGERRAFTANTIIRDPTWRRRDAAGALRICAADAASLGVEDAEVVRVTTRRGSVEVAVEISDTMQPGHISLPNGLGLSHGGKRVGAAPNELTSSEARDDYAGTPWHKYVPARVERISAQ